MKSNGGLGQVEEPKVSVVMSVWNVPHPWLVDSIESILNQSFQDFEFIMVDDGSTNSLFEVCRAYGNKDNRIRLFRFEQNKGVVAATNYGIEQARSNVIIRQDGDDISWPTRLEQQYRHLMEHPEIVLLGTQMEMIFENDVLPGNQSDSLKFLKWYNSIEAIDDDILMHYVPVANATFAFYKNKFVEAGMYKEEFRLIQEELVLRMRKLGKIEKLNQTLYQYRVHGNSTYVSNGEAMMQVGLKMRLSQLGDRMDTKTRVAIWGAGKGAQDFLALWNRDREKTFPIRMIIDGSDQKNGENLFQIPIHSKQDLNKETIDKVIVAVSLPEIVTEIREILAEKGYDRNDYYEIYPNGFSR